MSTAIAPDTDPRITAIEPRLFSVEDYHTMAKCGILFGGNKQELFFGRVVEMMSSRGFASLDECTTLKPYDSESLLGPHRYTIADFHRMIDSGIIKDDEGCELLFGQVVQKMTLNPIHNNCVELLNLLLIELLGRSASVRPQCTITLPQLSSEPEPDFAIVEAPGRNYGTDNPVPGQIHFLVEVANTSLREDRTIKLKLYAASMIPIYWIVNLVDDQLEVYTDPIVGHDPTYRTRTDYDLNDDVPVIIAGQQVGTLPVKEMFPS